MSSRRLLGRNPRAEGEILARFRPIAPRPANISSSPPPNRCSPPAPPLPDSRLPAKRSRSSPSSSSVAAPLKKLKSFPGASSPCASLRPLIPVSKPSSAAASCLTQERDLLSSARCELKTLPLLPDGSPLQAASPPSPCSDSSLTSPPRDRQNVGDPDSRLTELSLGSSSRLSGMDDSSRRDHGPAPAATRHFDNQLVFERSALPMAVSDARSGGIIWSNPAFSTARDGDLRHPVPLISFALGGDPFQSQAVLWVFMPDSVSAGGGVNGFFPMKPQAVRASIASGVLESLAKESGRESIVASLLVSSNL